MTGPAPRPPRRKRYRGTHPRRFEERYKEHDPRRYPEEQAKVAARGDTPAGSHRPVMLAEVLAALRPAPGEVFLDATLGHGGHARALAERVGPAGLVLGLDRDAEELSRTAQALAREGLPVRTRHLCFSGAAKALRAEGIAAVDGVLADLGLSSMQIDRPERGFSFKGDAPLDMRMDRSRGETAAEYLARVPEADLAEALSRHGDEPEAKRIAAAIASRRASGPPIERTRDVASIVLRAQGIDPRGYRQTDAADRHPAARTFQAIRIVVNREDEHLAALLRDLPFLLAPGGRAAIIAFHSGEEKRVAEAFAAGLAEGLYAAADIAPLRPSPAEQRDNPRSRSARLFTSHRCQVKF